jgi:hypothetical protein
MPKGVAELRYPGKFERDNPPKFRYNADFEHMVYVFESCSQWHSQEGIICPCGKVSECRRLFDLIGDVIFDPSLISGRRRARFERFQQKLEEDTKYSKFEDTQESKEANDGDLSNL